MNLAVNRLPSTTWNRLGMNVSTVSLEEKLENHIPAADYDPAEILWNGDYDGKAESLSGDLSAVTETASLGFGRTESGVNMQAPLVLSYAYGNGEKAASRLTLQAEADSHLKAIVILQSPMEAELTSVLQANLFAGKNAVLDLYLVDLLGSEALCLNHIAGLAEDNARINLIRLDLGGRQIYSGVNMDLSGADSSFSSETGYHVKPGQVLDMNYVAVHNGKRTLSQMEVNGTLEEGAKKIFRGTIDFRQGCAGAKAGENENVMLMGEQMINQTIPVILCKEEDVEGNHGASIGQLDDKVLFYLGSRGISRKAAQAIIAQARIDAICEKIPEDAVKQQIREFEEVRGISHGEEF